MSRLSDRPANLLFWLLLAALPLLACAVASSFARESGRTPAGSTSEQPLQPGHLPGEAGTLGTCSDWVPSVAESELRGGQDRLPVRWRARACPAGRAVVGRVEFLSECPAASWIGTYTPSAEFCVVLRRFRI